MENAECQIEQGAGNRGRWGDAAGRERARGGQTASTRRAAGLGTRAGEISGVSGGAGLGAAAFADFNGDGNLDLMFTQGNAHFGSPVALQVNLGKGDGTFTPGPRVATLSNPPGAIVAGDFNRDGALDLAVTGFTTLYFGNGDGTFSKGVLAGTGSLTLAEGDFNGDGKLDLLSEVRPRGRNACEIRVLLGNGDGTFQKARQVVTVPSPGFSHS